MKLLNLTPHVIRIIDDGSSEPIVIPPCGTVARVATVSREMGRVGGIKLFAQVVGEVQGLPDPRDGVLLIVSTIVRTALPERVDLCSPGELVRDASGQPIGCRGLVINTPTHGSVGKEVD